MIHIYNYWYGTKFSLRKTAAICFRALIESVWGDGVSLDNPYGVFSFLTFFFIKMVFPVWIVRCYWILIICVWF
jgi:hypothetical protein